MSSSSRPTPRRFYRRMHSSRSLRPSPMTSTTNSSASCGPQSKSSTSTCTSRSRPGVGRSLSTSNLYDNKTDKSHLPKVVRWQDESSMTYPSQESPGPPYKKKLLDKIAQVQSSTRAKELDIATIELEIRVLKEHVRIRTKSKQLSAS